MNGSMLLGGAAALAIAYGIATIVKRREAILDRIETELAAAHMAQIAARRVRTARKKERR